MTLIVGTVLIVGMVVLAKTERYLEGGTEAAFMLLMAAMLADLILIAMLVLEG
jgi:threonine/homoserine/homoserine lactone efflux protein